MSEVDKRVVKFEFDNSKFERNVKQSMSTLDKLKERLNFSNVSDNLDKVSVKISAVEIAAISAISNITNRLIDLSIRFVKMLSVDNLASGWAKFGDKTISVATMMAQKIRIAGKEITDVAEKTKVVNEQLELLAWFSDETSYSFTDMTENVGKFIATGQDLDKSVKAMEGIATWAAKAGQNSQVASRAMYQLAQAMGKGKIQRIDWMSIQNANMDTEEFRETILETAVAMKELTKSGDKFVTKTGKKFTKSQFADFLSEGWFTSDVLMKGLSKYSAAVEQIYEIAQRENLTASQVMEKYGDQLDEFGKAAFKASQEARTFLDVVNAIKDAVSTGWMVTFENIFGAYEDARELWSDLADELYNVFVEGGNFRNDILNTWKELEGRADLFKHGETNQGAFWNLYDAVVALVNIVKESFRDIFPRSLFSSYDEQVKDLAKRFKAFTKRLQESTTRILDTIKNSERLRNILRGLFSVLEVGLVIIKAIRYALDPIITVIMQLGDRIITLASDIGISLTNTEGIITKIINLAQRIQDVLVNIINFVDPVGLLDKTVDLLGKLLNGLETFVKKAIEYSRSFVSYMSSMFGTFVQSIKDSGVVTRVFDRITKAFKGFKESISDTSDTVSKNQNGSSSSKRRRKSPVTDVGVVLDSKDVDIVEENIENQSRFSKTIKNLLEAMIPLWEAVKKLSNAVIILVTVGINALTSILNAISDFANRIINYKTDWIGKTVLILGIVITGLSLLAVLVMKLFDTITWFKLITKPLQGFGVFFDSLSGALDGIMVKMGIGAISNLIKQIGLSMLTIAASLLIFEQVKSGWWKGGLVLAGLIAMVVLVTKFMTVLSSDFKILNDVTSGASEGLGLFGKGAKKISNTIQGVIQSTPFMNIAFLVRQIGKAMLSIAIAFQLLQNVNRQGLITGSIILTVLIAGTALLAIFSKKLGQFAPSFKNVYPSIGSAIGIVIASWGLAKAMQRLSTIKSGELLAAFGVIALLSGILLGFTYLLNENDMTMDWQIFKGLALFNASLLAVVIALKILADAINQNGDGINKAFWYLAGLMASYVVLSLAMGLASRASESLQESIKALAKLTVSLLAFVVLLKALSKIELNKDAKEPLIIIGALLLVFTGIIYMLSRINEESVNNTVKLLKSMKNIILMLVTVSAALMILSKYFSGTQLILTASSISMVLAALIGSIFILSNIRANMKRAWQSLIYMGSLVIALSSVTAALYILSKYNTAQLILTATSIAIVLAALIGTVYVLGKIKTDIKQALSTLVLMIPLTIAMGNAIVGLYILSKYNFSRLILTATSIAIVLASIVASAFILGKIKTNIKQALSTLALMIPLTIVMSNAIAGLYILSKYNFSQLISSATSIAIVLAALVGAVLVLSKIKTSVKQAFNTLALMGSLLAMIIGVSYTLGILAESIKAFENIDWSTIGKAAAVLGGLVLIFTILSALASIPALTVGMLVVAGVFVAFALAITLVTTSLAKLFNALTNFLMYIRETGTEVRSIIADTLANVCLAIVDAAPAIKEAIVTLLTILVAALCEALLTNQKIIIDTIFGMLIQMLEALVTYGPIIAEYLLQLLDQLIEYAPQFVDKLWTLMGRVIDTVWNKLKQTPFVQKLLPYFEKIKEALTVVFNVFKKVNDGIKNAINTVWTWLKNNVWPWIQKVWNGVKPVFDWIKDKFEKVVGFVQNICNGVKNVVSDVFDMNSPSKVMEKDGEYIVAGLVNGLNNSEDDATSAMSNVCNAIKDTLDDEIDDDLVITPVVDLSNVTAGARDINNIMNGVGGSNVSASVGLANKVNSEINRTTKPSTNQNGSVTNNSQTDNYYNTFNIESDDPEEVARQIDIILQQRRLRNNLVKGGV